MDSLSGGGTVTLNYAPSIVGINMGAFTGTFNTGNQTINLSGTFISNGTGTRTLTLGSSTINIAGNGTAWNNTDSTNCTFTANTATINITDASAGAKTFATGTTNPPDWGGANITFSGSGTGVYTLSGAGTNIGTVTMANTGGAAVTFTMSTNGKGMKDLIFSGFQGVWVGAGSITSLTGNLTLASSMAAPTYTGAITFKRTSGTSVLTSNGITLANSIVMDGVGGTLQFADAYSSALNITLTNGTIDANSVNVTANTFSSNNSNTRVLNMGSTGTPQWTLTGSGTVWQTSGTTGWTSGATTATVNFTDSSSTQKTTAFGNTNADFGGMNVTYSGSGTGAYTCSGDGTVGNVLVTNTGGAGFTQTGAKTVTSLTFTGYTGTLTMTSNLILMGSLTLSSGMTTAGAGTYSFKATSGTKTITTNGVTLSSAVTVNGAGGTFQLQDALTLTSANTLTLTAGTLDTNGKSVTSGAMVANGSTTRVLTFTNTTWTLTGTGTVWNLSGSNYTFGAGGSLIVLTGASPTFGGGGNTYNNIWFASTGTAVNSNSNTFNDFKVDPGVTLQFLATSTTTVSTWTVVGTSGSGVITLASTIGGTKWNLVKNTAGIVSSDYLSLQDSAATPAFTWYAGANSTNVSSSNTGWIFAVPPGVGTSANFLTMF